MNVAERRCVRRVWAYYRRHRRQNLPWRNTRNAYRIHVSEVMLQQTQVDRVIPKYKSFLKRFSTYAKLAQAPLGDVLREWQGLGYNRRAKMLHECSKEIHRRGQTPTMYAELVKLPGVGPYTAGAIMAFAYNKPVPIIETNIRTAIIHHFFHDEVDVHDRAILRLTERLLDHKNPREWYYAMMDYGAYLKKTIGNQNVRSKHYVKQTPFKNSDRQIRGAILRSLAKNESTQKNFHKELPFDLQRIDAQIEQLKKEGMIVMQKKSYLLPE